jgi:hypothetical protein
MRLVGRLYSLDIGAARVCACRVALRTHSSAPKVLLVEKRSRFTYEEISHALRQVEGGTAVADVCRQVRVPLLPHVKTSPR